MFLKLSHTIMEYVDLDTEEVVTIRNRKRMDKYKARVRSIETVLVKMSSVRLIVADLKGNTMIHYEHCPEIPTLVNETPDEIYKLLKKENNQWILT